MVSSLGPVSRSNDFEPSKFDSLLDQMDDAVEMIRNSGAKIVEWRTNVKVIQFVTAPGNIKKISKIARESLNFVSYYTGKTYLPNVVKILKTASDVVDVYNLYRAAIFWYRYFNPKFDNGGKINKEKFKKNLENTLVKAGLGVKGSEELKPLINKITEAVLAKEKTLNKATDSEKQIREKIEGMLLSGGTYYLRGRAQEVSKNVKIKLKNETSPSNALAIALFTFADSIEVLFVLEKWKLLNLSKCSAAIGKVFPIFLNVSKSQVIQLITGVNVVGLTIIFANSSLSLYKSIKQYRSSDDEEQRSKLTKKMFTEGITIVTVGVDITCTVLPMVFIFSPPALAACAILSKSVGLVGAGVKLALLTK